MKGIKIELLGIAIIPLGIAVTTNNFWGYVLGVYRIDVFIYILYFFPVLDI